MSFPSVAFFAFLYFCASSTTGVTGDAPDDSFYAQYRELTGKCPAVPNAAKPGPGVKIEGRWYVVQTGLLPEQAKTITCYAWDSSFDNKGTLNNLISVKENGKLKTSTIKLTPIPGRYNVYAVDKDQTFKRLNADFTATLYVSKEVFVLGIVGCKETENYYESIVVGVRDLDISESLSRKINRIVNNLQYKIGFKSDKTRIKHVNCNYPK